MDKARDFLAPAASTRGTVELLKAQRLRFFFTVWQLMPTPNSKVASTKEKPNPWPRYHNHVGGRHWTDPWHNIECFSMNWSHDVSCTNCWKQLAHEWWYCCCCYQSSLPQCHSINAHMVRGQGKASAQNHRKSLPNLLSKKKWVKP